MNMLTTSLWGKPPSRFYRFVRRVEKARKPAAQVKFAILGCSDGKFVLPLARRGHYVIAVDIDRIALLGGRKTGPEGEVWMPGLRSRLMREGFAGSVLAVNADFVRLRPRCQFDGVFTSGAINYSYNLRHEITSVIYAVKSFVATGGFLYFDYMLPMDATHAARSNYFFKGELRKHFRESEWNVLYDRVLPPLAEKPHVDKPVHHFHHWGHLCAIRR